LMFYKLGGKQLYYFQTNDGQGELDTDKMISDNSVQELPAVEDDQDCESCHI